MTQSLTLTTQTTKCTLSSDVYLYTQNTAESSPPPSYNDSITPPKKHHRKHHAHKDNHFKKYFYYPLDQSINAWQWLAKIEDGNFFHKVRDVALRIIACPVLVLLSIFSLILCSLYHIKISIALPLTNNCRLNIGFF